MLIDTICQSFLVITVYDDAPTLKFLIGFWVVLMKTIFIVIVVAKFDFLFKETTVTRAQLASPVTLSYKIIKAQITFLSLSSNLNLWFSSSTLEHLATSI